MDSALERICIEIARLGMFRVGRFRLSSGLESPYYIDLRKLYSYPHLAKLVAEEMLNRFNLRRFEMVVGVATAGIALAAYIGSLAGVPVGYVRSERKGHGTQSVVEGVVEGRRVVIVDDVATTGSSIENAYRALVEQGARPMAAAVVVDREQGARERLERLGIEFYSLIKVRELVGLLRLRKLISDEEYAAVANYLGLERS